MAYIKKERTNGSKRVIMENFGQSKTKQQFLKSSNINTIIAKYKKTGMLPLVNQSPIFDDFSKSADLQTAFNTAIKAQAQFEMLPSELRKKLDNDPVKFMMYMEDKKNEEEWIKYGLVNKNYIDEYNRKKIAENNKPKEQ